MGSFKDLRDKIIKEAEEELSKCREGSEELEACLKYYRDFINSLDFAYENGRKEVFEVGYKDGLALESARKFKSNGMPVELIIKYTGLTIEKIEAL